MITGTTRLYAIVGDPVGHVRTPMAFNDYFAANGIDAACVAIHIGRDDIAVGWPGLKAIRNLDGFIVTAPYKAEAAALCDALEGDGAYTKVVNTVRREPDGRYAGTLLDGWGFVNGLNKAGYGPKGKRVYMAGAGGAGTALAFAMGGAGIAALTIHNRTRSKAVNLVARVGATFPNCEVKLGTADASGYDMVVNATSLGLKPDDPFSFDITSADSTALFAEVVMKPEFTPMLIAAQARGHKVHSGIHMLNGQLDMMMRFFGLAKQS
jgi:shikimate dehydrogenase